jgi:hypothetical protein
MRALATALLAIGVVVTSGAAAQTQILEKIAKTAF